MKVKATDWPGCRIRRAGREDVLPLDTKRLEEGEMKEKGFKEFKLDDSDMIS